MFPFWPSHFELDLQPIPYRGDFAERHAGLRHSEWAWVHAEENDTLLASAKFSQVQLVSCPGVGQWVIDVFNGRSERELIHRFAQSCGSFDETPGHGRYLPQQCLYFLP